LLKIRKSENEEPKNAIMEEALIAFFVYYNAIVIGTQKDRPRVFLTGNYMQKFKTEIER